MPGRLFRTLPDELIEYAEAVADYFEGLGYVVRVEVAELEHPYTAALTSKRHRTVVLVEVDSKVDFRRLDDWARYCRSCNTDTRIAISLPYTVSVSADDVQRLHSMGVGLLRCMQTEVLEVIPAQDLALHVTLPDLKSLPPKVRKRLGGAYEQFGRSNWREGFEDACQAIEAEARIYLKRGMKTRLTFLKPNGKPFNWTTKHIDKMTGGQLASAFKAISIQNRSDAVIGQGLARLSRDRIGVVHFKVEARTEKRLRENVGRHMWTVVAVLKELLGVK
jgi:hypothetical protein